MKKFINILVISVIGIFLVISCGSDIKMGSAKLKTQEDSVSYYLGLSYGAGLKQAEIDSLFNYNAFTKGMKEAATGDTLPTSQMEIETYLRTYFAKLQDEKVKNQYKDYMAENEAFLTNNAKKDSVITLPSGLQYVIIKEGNGQKPTMNDKVKVHYTGKVIDGTVFDSSYERKEPYEFKVGEVIPGWVEIIQLMPVGSKWRVYIPQELAYGSRGRGGVIQPFSTLIFDMELSEISPAN
jgi:FKBP-type peptidyl-prolyl cis-trans isomerase